MKEQYKTKNIPSKEPDIREIIEKYSYYWKAFFISILLCVGVAFFYLRYTPKVYNVQSRVLLQDENKSSGELTGLFEQVGLSGISGGPAFVTDQMVIMKSRRILRQVIEEHSFHIKYEIIGKFRNTEKLVRESPLQLMLVEPDKNTLKDSLSYSFEATILSNSTVAIKDENGLERKVGMGQKFPSPIGEILLLPQGNSTPQIGKQVRISYKPVNMVVGSLGKDIELTPNQEKQSYVVNLAMNSILPEKAELILNSLVEKYKKDMTQDKTRIIKATTEFINSRLKIVGGDLESADLNVAEFKQGQHVTDVGQEAMLYLQSANESEKRLIAAQTQLSLAEMMREKIDEGNYQLLPSNMGLEDASIEQSIRRYNEVVLERDDLRKSATLSNPVVMNLSRSLDELGLSLSRSLDNYNKRLSIEVGSLGKELTGYRYKLGNLPGQEQDFKPILRQQQIVESLYLFLLEKREEAEIKKAAVPEILKIIDTAYTSNSPVAPKGKIILLGSLMVGFIFPVGILFMKFALDNKVHTRKEIQNFIDAPILGEVPKSERRGMEDYERSPLAESIRLIRSNIEFMIGKNPDQTPVLFVTSTVAREGKSFISTNLAHILTLSNKKVLLIGADIRNPKILEYLDVDHLDDERLGISQYLSSADIAVEDLVIHSPGQYDFDIIHSGKMPPNPAELLQNGRFSNVIQYARENYDFVLVDTAPVASVSDTLAIIDQSDLTLFVVRSNFLETRMLEISKELYESGRIKKMAVVLNSVDFAKNSYGYHGYGSAKDYNRSFGERFKRVFRKKRKKVNARS